MLIKNSFNFSDFSTDKITPLLNIPGNVFIYCKDLNGNYVACNPLTATTLGFASIDDFVGLNDNDLPVLKKEIQQYKNEDKKVITSQQQQIFKESITTKTQAFKALVYKFPLFDQKDIVGVFGFAYFTKIRDASHVEKPVFTVNDIKINEKVNDCLHVRHFRTHEMIYLSSQQTKCLIELLKAKTSKEIAKQLHLSHRTVEHYLERIRIILGCSSNKELIFRYSEQLYLYLNTFNDNKLIDYL